MWGLVVDVDLHELIQRSRKLRFRVSHLLLEQWFRDSGLHLKSPCPWLLLLNCYLLLHSLYYP